MESLTQKYQSLCDATDRLFEELDKYENMSEQLRYEHERTVRNSLIHTFEFTIELLWRSLHEYVSEKHGVKVTHSAGQAFRTARTTGVISDDEFDLLMSCLIDRNKSSHAYQEVMAIDIANSIPVHYKIIKIVVARINPESVP